MHTSSLDSTKQGRRTVRLIAYFLLGGAYAALAAGFAMVLGSGLGHGTDFFARVPLAPFAMSRAAFDQGSFLPILACAVWGLAFAAGGTGSRPTMGVTVVWLVVHYVSVAILFRDAPTHPLWPWLLLPYATGQLGLWLLLLIRFRRARGLQ
jgi:hypothetical protein